jgi:hypothetical protein
VALLGGLLSAAIAAALTLDNADGVWSNARNQDGGTAVSCLQYVGDNNVAISQDANVEDENGVRYGLVNWSCDTSQSGLDKKSGFGFDGSNGDFSFEPGQVFLLGEVTHYNRPINAFNVLTSVDLALGLALSDPLLNTTLNYTLHLDETPNSPGENPGGFCPYGASTDAGCDDKVSFPSALPDQVFDIGGKTYTLQIVGFVRGTAATCSAEDPILANFITGENHESKACLFGRILEVAYDFGDAPDFGGQTLLATDGARHAIDPNGPYLGCTRPDADPDGLPNPAATGDDMLDGDDEDGCSFVFPDDDFSDGEGSVEVTVAGLAEFSSACVKGWIDWAGDGFANDPVTAVTVTENGPVTLVFNTSGPVPVSNYMRLRVLPGACPAQTESVQSDPPPDGARGLVQGGEVEDFLINAPTAVGLTALGATGGGGGITAVFLLLGAALLLLSAVTWRVTQR